jgi:hypothetical protein
MEEEVLLWFIHVALVHPGVNTKTLGFYAERPRKMWRQLESESIKKNEDI